MYPRAPQPQQPHLQYAQHPHPNPQYPPNGYPPANGYAPHDSYTPNWTTLGRDERKLRTLEMTTAWFIRILQIKAPSAIKSLIVQFARECAKGLWFSATTGRPLIRYDHKNDIIFRKGITNVRLPLHNCFTFGVSQEHVHTAITALDIGYSSCKRPLQCPAAVIRAMHTVDVDTRRVLVTKQQIAWARDDVVPARTLQICDGLNEWVNEMIVYSGHLWGGSHIFVFKTNTGKEVRSFDERTSQRRDVWSFAQCIATMKKEVIKPPSETFRLCGFYGHQGLVIDTMGFVFAGPQHDLSD